MKNNNELKILNILNNYYGINKNQIYFLCNELGINQNKLNKINTNLLDILKKEIKDNYLVDDHLSYLIEDNKNEKILNKTFTGIRLRQGLPCRGQRTRSNARTARKLK